MDIKFLQGSPFRQLILASAVCVLAAASAAASPLAPSERSVTVGYHDLDLKTIEGANTLYRRLRRAARFVCGENGRSLLEQRTSQTCFDDALTRAVATVNNPLLTGVHSQAGRGTA
jgi:UrcA family protein